MSRGLTDPTPEPEQQDESMENIIHQLIDGHNRLHDRLVQLEKELDHLKLEKQDKKSKWRKGL